MVGLLVPRSPLIVVSTTIVVLIATGAMLLLTLICEWLNPYWSRTIIVLQLIALLVGMSGDALLNGRRVLPFVPRRIRVYGGYVSLDEAALFFRIPPDMVRLYCDRDGRTIVAGRTGEAYIALDDLMAVVAAINRQAA